MPSLNQSGASSAARFGVAALTEVILPGAELGLLLADPVFWGMNVPRGDGHPVMLLPGLFANDDYLQPLSNWLRRARYQPIWSGLRFDPGWSEAVVARIAMRVESEHLRCGARVSIIGHSMGGALARSVALRSPNSVRQVISLGAPINRASNSPLSRSVGITAIYTRGDVIVRYPQALALDVHARNIEVTGSHSGLAMNGEVYRHLASLLLPSS